MALTWWSPYWNKHPLENLLGKSLLHGFTGSNADVTSGVIPEQNRKQDLNIDIILGTKVSCFFIFTRTHYKREEKVLKPCFRCKLI